jgi:hypothetical protein
MVQITITVIDVTTEVDPRVVAGRAVVVGTVVGGTVVGETVVVSSLSHDSMLAEFLAFQAILLSMEVVICTTSVSDNKLALRIVTSICFNFIECSSELIKAGNESKIDGSLPNVLK